MFTTDSPDGNSIDDKSTSGRAECVAESREWEDRGNSHYSTACGRYIRLASCIRRTGANRRSYSMRSRYGSSCSTAQKESHLVRCWRYCEIAVRDKRASAGAGTRLCCNGCIAGCNDNTKHCKNRKQTYGSAQKHWILRGYSHNYTPEK